MDRMVVGLCVLMCGVTEAVSSHEDPQDIRADTVAPEARSAGSESAAHALNQGGPRQTRDGGTGRSSELGR